MVDPPYIHKKTYSNDPEKREEAAYLLGGYFKDFPKNDAWADLRRLTQDNDCDVRWSAADALCLAFPHVPDKNQAWEDLLRLTRDEDRYVRWCAAAALGSAFPYVPDKKQVWANLCQLTSDKDTIVRLRKVGALGSAFPYVPDKKQAWADLYRFIKDKDKDVRASAYHSLGRASIFKATEAESEEDFRKELEEAIKFFENASKEAVHFNPASFCLPFYRSFYTITFNKNEAKAEVNHYLAEAKRAVGGSESKEILLEAVKNLASALEEAQAQKIDFDTRKDDLNNYRRYCEYASNLLDTTEDKAPSASRLIRKGLPILNERIKEVVVKIQEKAMALCKQTKDTPLERLGIETNEKAKQLSVLNDLSLEGGFNRLITTVLRYCGYMQSSEKKTEVCDKIKVAKNMIGGDKANMIAETLEYIADNIDVPSIENVFISKRVKNIIRIATVQVHFELLIDSFPPKFKDIEAMKTKILNLLKRAKKDGADVVCFPELCICEEWLPEIKSQCQKMIIISGSYYDNENHNVCKLILDSDINVPPQLKINPSAFEDSRIMGCRMVPGEKLVNVYETQFGKFAILICRDFGNFIPFLRGKVDMIFVPSYNQANNRFHKDADNHVTNSPSYVIISNTALYGGTSIFGQLNFEYFNALENGGCKKKGDRSYKLCEIEQEAEGIIIADFNLSYKSPQKQSPIDPGEEIVPVENIQKIKL